jgi:hypothetical protein
MDGKKVVASYLDESPEEGKLCRQLCLENLRRRGIDWRTLIQVRSTYERRVYFLEPEE